MKKKEYIKDCVKKDLQIHQQTSDLQIIQLATTISPPWNYTRFDKENMSIKRDRQTKDEESYEINKNIDRNTNHYQTDIKFKLNFF